MATYNGTADNDSLAGGWFADTLNGYAGDDTLFGNMGSDRLYGGEGNDRLDGGTGNDTMDGGNGNDYYVFNVAGDTVVELAGALSGIDTVETAITLSLGRTDLINVENALLSGTAGNSLTGNALANQLVGNSGNNTLDGGLGNDSLFGGAGNDTLKGGDGQDWLVGEAGNDSLLGGAGNDTLNGGAGSDTLEGGSGNDFYQVDDLTDRVTELAGTANGIDLIYYDFATVTQVTLAANVEQGVLLGTLPHQLIGNLLDNILVGNDGHNTMNGGAGADILQGGLGNDTYVIDNTGDAVIEAINGGTDTVQSSVGFNLATAEQVENLTLTGTGHTQGLGNGLANQVTGNTGNNLLTGGAGNDHLAGLGGDDTLDGGTGDDLMVGGTGNDVYWVDSELDQVIEASGGGTDTLVTTLSSYTLSDAGQIENLVFQGDGAIGYGNAGNNAITGSSGADMLDGGAGADTLAGGAGEDFYVFSGDFGADTVIESDSSQDIDILGLADVNPDQLWFSHLSGTNDLQVSVIGTSNTVTLSNWYAGSDITLEYVQVSTPTQEILSLARADVDVLVQAMAGLPSPQAGQTSLSAQQHQVLDPLIAANWVYWSPTA